MFIDAENSASRLTFAHHRLWLSLGCALILNVVYLSPTPSPVEIPVAGGDKFEHLLAYGTLMVWFSNIYGKSILRLELAIGFVVMGIGLEFIQGWTGYRSFEIADMAANAAGVIAGWAIAPPRTPNFLLIIEKLSISRR